MRLKPSLTRRRLETVAALLVYAAFTVYLTWPLLPHLGSSAYLVQTSPYGGDIAGSIAHMRELVEGHHIPFLPGRVHDFDAPGGLEIRWALNLATVPSTTLVYVLALMFGATAAYGLFVMLGYVASGLAMFLLVRHLTQSAWIGLIAGWAFAFYPYAVVKGEHPNFIHGWVFVVMVWRFLRLLEEPTRLNGVWAGLASILAFSWTQHFVLIGGICFAALTGGTLVVAAARRQFRRQFVAQLLSLGLAVAFVLLIRGLLFSSGEGTMLRTSSFAAVLSTSARLPMYVVPPAHHVLGSLTVSYLNEHGWNAVEWTIYVGITVLALAAAGVVAALLRRLPSNLGACAFVAACTTLVAFAFSLPPTTQIAGKTVRLPSDLVYYTSSAWRIYTRLVIVVMLGLCILAALGLLWLTSRRSHRVRAVILVAATALVPLDLWDRPPDHIYRFKADPIYHVLRAQPQGTVAEYPLRPVDKVGHYLDLYYQDAYGKPILNGYPTGPDEQRALALARLDDPATAGHLRTIGVHYVLLTHRFIPDVESPGRPGYGFRLLSRDNFGSLYRVAARPVPFVFAQSGLEPHEATGVAYRWATASKVELEVMALCDQCVGTLRFLTASFGSPRVLKIRTEEGKPLLTTFVEAKPRRLVSIPLRFSRRIVIVLSMIPGPQSIHETTGADDPRSVGIYVQDPRFVGAKR